MTRDEKREYMRAYRERHRERIAEQKKAWDAAHPGYRTALYVANAERYREYARNFRARRPEAVQAIKARYRATNLDFVRAESRRWYWENLERARENATRYSEAHKEERAAYVRANRERINERFRRAYAADRERHIQYVKKRYRLKRATEGTHTLDEWASLLAMFGGRCTICGTDRNITEDHIVPLTKGGSDWIDNIQPLCRSCNARKGNRVILRGVGYLFRRAGLLDLAA